MIIKILLFVLLYLFVGAVIANVADKWMKLIDNEEHAIVVTLFWPFYILVYLTLIIVLGLFKLVDKTFELLECVFIGLSRIFRR